LFCRRILTGKGDGRRAPQNPLEDRGRQRTLSSKRTNEGIPRVNLLPSGKISKETRKGGEPKQAVEPQKGSPRLVKTSPETVGLGKTLLSVAQKKVKFDDRDKK